MLLFILMKIYLLSWQRLFALMVLGWVCASEVKECGITDEEQLKYAAKNNYILVTHNIRDFIKLHKDSVEKELNHSGIILARRRRDNYEFARRLLEFLKKTETDDLSNQVRHI